MHSTVAHRLLWARPSRHRYFISADDGNKYFVSTPADPFRAGPKSLCLRIAALAGVRTARVATIQVTEEFHESSPDTPVPGHHLGVRFPVDPAQRAIYDMLPDRCLPLVRERERLGALRLLDIWFANSQPGRVIYCRDADRLFTPYAIGFGHCFSSEPPEWCWSSRFAPLHDPQVWAAATNAIGVVQRITCQSLRSIVADTPLMWAQHALLYEKVDLLLARRKILQTLLEQVREQDRLRALAKPVHRATTATGADAALERAIG